MEYEIEIYRNRIVKPIPGPKMFFLSNWNKEYFIYNYVFVLKGNGHIILVDTGCGNVDKFNEFAIKELEGKNIFNILKMRVSKL